MTQIPFGKYSKGSDIRELDKIPSDYFVWLQQEEWFEENWPEVAEQVEEIMAERESNGTHWNKWEEEMNMSDVIYGKGKDFV